MYSHTHKQDASAVEMPDSAVVSSPDKLGALEEAQILNLAARSDQKPEIENSGAAGITTETAAAYGKSDELQPSKEEQIPQTEFHRGTAIDNSEPFGTAGLLTLTTDTAAKYGKPDDLQTSKENEISRAKFDRGPEIDSYGASGITTDMAAEYGKSDEVQSSKKEEIPQAELDPGSPMDDAELLEAAARMSIKVEMATDSRSDGPAASEAGEISPPAAQWRPVFQHSAGGAGNVNRNPFREAHSCFTYLIHLHTLFCLLLIGDAVVISWNTLREADGSFTDLGLSQFFNSLFTKGIFEGPLCHRR